MDITDNKDVIWERIEDGGPTSLVVSCKKNINTTTTALLNGFEEKLKVHRIIPVRIDCRQHVESIEFFKAIFNAIWEIIPDDYRNETSMFKDMMNMAADTSMTDAVMEKFLQVVKNDMKLSLLLVLENFDVVVSHQEEADLMKIRGMTSYINMLTVSFKMLETLALENNQEEYFCNQFKAYTI